MPFISAAQAPHFELHGAAFVGLASPSRGSTANSVWMVTLLDSGQAVPHRLSREETLVCIEGCALASLSGEVFEMTPGSAVVIPPETEFSIRNPYAAPFRAVAVLPVGGQVTIASQQPFTPPWAS